MQVPAKPAGFLLKMRVVAPDGVPFRNRPFRVKWGNTLSAPGKTDADGAISIHLDAGTLSAPQGEVQFMSGSDEMVVWSIPLQIADEPEPITLEGLEDIGPAPAPPSANAGPDEIQAYDQECVRHRDRIVMHIREHIEEFEQIWDEPRIDASILPPPPPRMVSNDELLDAWNKLLESGAIVHDEYEAAFRLWNLADLPLPNEPSLPFMTSDREMLERAMARFAYRHGLTADEPMTGILEKLKAVHDKQGSVAPKRGG